MKKIIAVGLVMITANVFAGIWSPVGLVEETDGIYRYDLENGITATGPVTTLSGFIGDGSGITNLSVSGGAYRLDGTRIYPDISTATNNVNSANAYSAVLSGASNYVSSSGSFIGGGGGNSISNVTAGAYTYNLIGGGLGNKIALNTTYSYGTIAGGNNNKALGNGGSCFIGGGIGNINYSIYGVIGGGVDNGTGGDLYAFVGGGQGNDANGSHSVVAGGSFGTAGALYSTVSGGDFNKISSAGTASVIAGGGQNAISNQYSVISGGLMHEASGGYSTVGGGLQNRVRGGYSFIPGGVGNDVFGDISSAFGGYNTIPLGVTNAYIIGSNATETNANTLNLSVVAKFTGGTNAPAERGSITFADGSFRVCRTNGQWDILYSSEAPVQAAIGVPNSNVVVTLTGNDWGAFTNLTQEFYLNGFTATNGVITPNENAWVRGVSFDPSFSGGNNSEYEMGLFVDGVMKQSSIRRRTLGASGAVGMGAICSEALYLYSTSRVWAAVRDVGVGGADVTLFGGTLKVER